MKEIALSCGYVALVDDDMYAELSKWKWHALKGRTTWYANRNVRVYNYSGGMGYVSLSMHRYIAKAMPGSQVDHINHNGLDNRKTNLRITDAKGNSRNARPHKGKTYKGVGFTAFARGRPRPKPWRARIRVNGKLIHVGWYATERGAALAYNEAAKQHFGEFAYLNKLAESSDASQ